MQYSDIDNWYQELGITIFRILFLLFILSLFSLVYMDDFSIFFNPLYSIPIVAISLLILLFNIDLIVKMLKILKVTCNKYPLMIFLILLSSLLILFLFKNHYIYYFKFLLILTILHITLIFMPEAFLHRLFMLKFLNFRIFIKKRTNLLYNSVDYKKHSRQIALYITQVGNQYDVDNSLKNRFYDLFLFWYANSFYQFKYRAVMSIFFIIVSVLSYSSFCYLIYNAELGNVSNNVLIVIYLIFLAVVMLHYIDNFLNIDNLLNLINIDLNRYFFKTSTNRQKILLFLQKNFTVYINDKIANRRVVLNSNDNFKRMIKSGYYDKRGRNLLVGLFVSLLFIIFVQLTSVMLIAQPQLESNPQTDNQTLQIKD